ncbi:hypothetical protein [uncultured Flavobacterium sp.]|uniref:hypothetical protein n=1 Tax=uncultured Flavobacterium sp. TaxID=165435 RepID=UPI0030CA185B|tara:strand:- start:47 stop:439 length:393 start_codon:yes stop_codon:yes gene_type:complete
MNTKKFITGGIAGGITNFLLGWLLWGVIFKDSFPMNEENNMSLLFIFLGSLSFGFFVSYIFSKWAQITTYVAGAKAAVVISLFVGLNLHLFQLAQTTMPNYNLILLDLGLMLFCGAILGAVIAVVHSEIK